MHTGLSPETPSCPHNGLDPIGIHLNNPKSDVTVAQCNTITDCDIADQAGVLDINQRAVRLGRTHHQRDLLARRNNHPGVAEGTSTDLRSRKVGQDRNGPGRGIAGSLHSSQPVEMVVQLSVRKVQTKDINTSRDQTRKLRVAIGCWPHGGDDLGAMRFYLN